MISGFAYKDFLVERRLINSNIFLGKSVPGFLQDISTFHEVPITIKADFATPPRKK
jgi:hypothetical protein